MIPVEKKREEIATKNLSYLVGAKIIAVEPYLNSAGYFRSHEIGDITIETTDGSKLSLQAGGYDEDRYMEVEPVLEEDA